ncbi:MAG TPA: AhpC/TSA family protein, partial [Verrucomicrobiae bacterium]|nr:AhpC/TSA family protein [Verrucomicrobiae bacterium]
ELPWPQYCDAKGWENHFGLRFDINNVPMLWLVDRQGVLRETFAREDFTEAAEKLLAEKP